MPPVLSRAASQVFRGFLPFPLQTYQGRCNRENHERELEIKIGQCKAGDAVQIKSRLVNIERTGLTSTGSGKTDISQDRSQETGMSQGGDERKSQRHTTEIGSQSRKTHQDVSHPDRRLPYGNGIGHKKTHYPAQHRCDYTDLQADAVGFENIRIQDYADIAQCEITVLILERADKKVGGWQNEKYKNKYKERKNTDPIPEWRKCL